MPRPSVDRPGRFAGQVALVTGGSAGIGLAAARQWAEEGASVMIAARRTDVGEAAAQSIRDAGGEARFVAADMSDPASIKAMVDATVAAYGRLDIAFNNAGRTSNVAEPIHEANPEDFEDIIAVNTKGAWYACKYQFAEMLKVGGGSIIICGSMASIRGGTGKAAGYYTSKHAIMGLMKQVAMDGAKHNIRCNAVLPGLVMTEIVANKFAKVRTGLDNHFASIPMGRPGEPEEIAAAAVFLSSKEASYITGAHLSVDGGYSV